MILCLSSFVGILFLLILSEHTANSQGDSREIDHDKGVKGHTTTTAELATTTTTTTTSQPKPPPITTSTTTTTTTTKRPAPLPVTTTTKRPPPVTTVTKRPAPPPVTTTTKRPTPRPVTTTKRPAPRPVTTTTKRPAPRPVTTKKRPAPPPVTTKKRPAPPKPQYHRRQYIGCYTDKANPRAMMNFSSSPQTNTIDNCLNICHAHGFQFSGTEYGYECFCSRNLPNAATHPKRPDSQCNMKCRGNRRQTCGGRWGISVYATGRL